MMNDLLLIAGPEGRDAELVAAAASERPRRVTVLIEARHTAWAWSESGEAIARRDRLATLLSAVERATRATVVGLVGDPARLDPTPFDGIVGAGRLRHAA
jgi:hypothetical protein